MFKSIRIALQKRKQICIPSIYKQVVLIGGLIVLMIIIAYFLSPSHNRYRQFTREPGVITLCSALFLATAGVLAARSFSISRHNTLWIRSFWLLAAIVLVFFATDELLQFHEEMGKWITESSIGDPGIFRNWNDVIVISYGAVALVALILFLPVILRYPLFAEALGLAFAFYCIHTLIDSTVQPWTTWSAICEESAKLMSTGALAVSMWIGLLGVKEGRA